MWRLFKWMTGSVLALGASGCLAIVALYFWVKQDLPDTARLKDVQLETPLKIYSADGKLISQFGEKRRIPLALEDIPPQLIHAFLATEDARFYQHIGVDPIGIFRAALVWAMSGQAKQGASTITQQVARNFFLTREKTIIRKVKEIFLAWHIEKLLSKDEILELYLNKIPLGQRAFGVGAAAQVYYGKDVSELTLGEMAVIAGLPKAPSVLNPIFSPERARERRAVVLSRMLETKKVTNEQVHLALQEPVETHYHGAEIELYSPYLAEMVRQEVLEKYGERAYTQGLNVYTTVTSSRQLAAEKAVVEGLISYDMRHGYRGVQKLLWNTADARWSAEDITRYLKQQVTYSGITPAVVTALDAQSAQFMLDDGRVQTLNWDGMKWARPYIDDNRQGREPSRASEILKEGAVIRVRLLDDGNWQLSQLPEANAALVSLNPHDGAIEALVGGFNFNLSKFNRVNQAKRLLGSNIKPFIYAAAFENDFTLASLVDDAPINEWDPSQGIAWRPKNSPAVYHGPTRLRDGLARSKNVMTVRLLRQIGLPKVIDTLTRFNFPKEDIPFNESLSLGAIAVTPLQAVTGFSAFANGGFLVEPYFISHIDYSDGTRLYTALTTQACPECTQPVIVDEICTEQNDAGVCQQTNTHYRIPARQVLSEQTAFLVADALRSAIWGDGSWRHGTGWSGTGWRTAKALKRHDVSGKTGTTNDARDAWFSGFNPDLVTSVWIGFDDYLRELGRTRKNANLSDPQIVGAEFGANAAQPIWIHFNRVVLANFREKKIQPPQGIVSVRIDRKTGLLTYKSDHTTRFEYFKVGSEPVRYAQNSSENNVTATSSLDELF